MLPDIIPDKLVRDAFIAALIATVKKTIQEVACSICKECKTK